MIGVIMKYSRLLIFMMFISGMFLLCACDKDDYKKAMEAEESGDYETAIALFSKLSGKNYEDSASRLETVKIRQIVDRLNAGDWDKVDCQKLENNKQIVTDITGDPDMPLKCFFQKAQFYHEKARYEDALNELQKTFRTDDVPNGFDRDQMIFDNNIALCKTMDDQDQVYQCLLDLAPYETQFNADTYSDFFKEKNVFYSDDVIGRMLFWRELIGESGSFEQMDFSGYMDRCLSNKGEYWCARDHIFDIIYFSEGDPVQTYQKALAWAEQQERTIYADRLKEEPKRCIRNIVSSDCTGIAYPVDAPAACEAVFRPELEAWFQENGDSSVPAEGFWDSDTFYETFGFDTAAPEFSGIYSIRNRFRAGKPYPKSVAIIVSSGAEFDRPEESWRDDPEMTDDIIKWVNDTAAAYKKTLPDWTFIDDPSQAAYILFYSLTWQNTGTFAGEVNGEDVKISVYNLRISGEAWENREHGWRNKIFSKESDLGQGYEGKFTPGVTQVEARQFLTILSENPLTIHNAEYDPETGCAYSVNRPDGYSSELVSWLQEIESEQTVE